MEEILRDLIGFPTVTGDESVEAALVYISDFCEARGMSVKKYRSHGYPSLVISAKPNQKHFKLLLAAHIDVVPAPSELFQVRKHDGRYYGRGVFDMKFAVASYLTAIDRLRDTLQDYDFGLMIVSDEEPGLSYGTKYLLDRGYAADFCLLPDGGDNWHIEAAAKGLWHIEVSTNGLASHGSRPWEGENAIYKLLQFLNGVRERFPEPELHSGTTAVISTLQAGTALNQIPDEAHATIDFRYLDDTTTEELQTSVCTLAKAFDITIRTQSESKPLRLDTEHLHITAWEAIVKQIHGEARDEYALSFGGSDARFLADFGIPTIVTRPDGGGAHSKDEWIDIQGFEDFTDCVTEYIKAIAKVDENGVKGYTEPKLPETATVSKQSPTKLDKVA